MIWRGKESFKTNVTDYLKSIFKFGSDEIKTFAYIGIELTQNSNYGICIEQNNYIAGISRQVISFSVCEAHAKFKNVTVADVYYVNKITIYVKSTKNCIKFPHLNLITLQIKPFTDASFNNLPDGGSQGRQIIFILYGSNTLCHLCWNSSKNKSWTFNYSNRNTITTKWVRCSNIHQQCII